MMPEDFVQLLQKVKPRGKDKWMACCPAHDDSDPSLAVASTPSGKILLKCYAGCSALEITQSLGLGLPDLFPDAYEENPLGFARRERAQKDREASRINHEKTILDIADAKRERGERLTPADLQREREAFLAVRGSK